MTQRNFVPPNHEFGYTASFLKEEMTKHGYDYQLFKRWMAGQTVAWVNEEVVYYEHDVLRYINMGGPLAHVVD